MEPTERSPATDGTRLRTLCPGCFCSSECVDAGVSWSSHPVAGRAGRGHHWPWMEPTGRSPATARSRPRTNLPGWPCSSFDIRNYGASSRGSSQESPPRLTKSLPLLLFLASCYLWKHQKTGMVVARRVVKARKAHFTSEFRGSGTLTAGTGRTTTLPLPGHRL